MNEQKNNPIETARNHSSNTAYPATPPTNATKKNNSNLEQAAEKGQLAKDAGVINNTKPLKNSGNSKNKNNSIPNRHNAIAGTNHYRNQNRSNTGSKNSIGKKATSKALSAVAKKHPVINAISTAANRIRNIKSQQEQSTVGSFGRNIFSNALGGLFKGIGGLGQSEKKDALNNEEEDKANDDDVESVNVNFSTVMKYLIFGLVGGAFFVIILTGCFMFGGMIDTGGKGWLAAHQNPTMEELEKAFNAQNPDDLNSSNSSNNTNSSGYAIKTGSTSNIIMVGDSRTVAICRDVYSGTDCEKLGYKKNQLTFISKIGEGYSWFQNTALSEVKQQLDKNKKSTVFLSMGCNGLDNAENYAKYYNDLAKSYPESNIVAVSVTPIIDAHVINYKNIENDANVVKFNSSLKSKLSNDVVYCDVYSKVKGKISDAGYGDGIHYDAKSNRLVNTEMRNCLKTTSVSSSGSLTANKTLTANSNKPSGVYAISSEPEPWAVINYFSNLDRNNFIYPVDKATGLKLGAWPKNYKTIPTQLSGCKLYQGSYIWPTTPSGGKYSYVYPHNGIDIMSDFGTPIYSPVDGTLIYSEWGHTQNKGSDETAYSVTIQPSKVVSYGGIKIDMVYMTHMSGIRYRCEWGKCNRKVKKGELIGFVGTAAGNSTSAGYASHLHMSLYPDPDYSSGLHTPSIEKFYNISSGTKRKACE